MEKISQLFGKLFERLAVLACILLFLMMIVICADVLLRNVPMIASMRGFPATNDLCICSGVIRVPNLNDERNDFGTLTRHCPRCVS